MATTYLTRDNLLTRLRRRLQDAGTEQYLDSELNQCLSTAYRETVVLSKCHKTTVTCTLIASTTTYDVTRIFEPIQVYRAANTIPILDKTQLADIAVYASDWGSQTNATPLKWMMMTGSTIRVSPPPSSAVVAADPKLIVYGYAFPTDFSGGSSEIDALPLAYGASAVLDRAEAEARRLRLTQDQNAELMAWRMAKWQDTLELIRQVRVSAR